MLGIAEPRAKPKAEWFYRPHGTDLPFTSFPSTSYWATFTESLRGKSPHRTILALKLTRMGFSLGYVPKALWADGRPRRSLCEVERPSRPRPLNYEQELFL